MLMTAAGTIAPAQALVIGAGVAGLQAIATARRLGAVVSAFDVRPAVAGAGAEPRRDVPRPRRSRARRRQAATRSELTPEQQAQQQAALEERIPEFDVVITTAARSRPPGAEAHPGERGRAHARRARSSSTSPPRPAATARLTRPGRGRRARRRDASSARRTSRRRWPYHASQLYSRNVGALLTPPGARTASSSLDWDDEITSGACVTRAGEPA